MTHAAYREVHLEPRLLDSATDHAYCHNHSGVNQVQEVRQLRCWSSTLSGIRHVAPDDLTGQGTELN